jgi:hypothetical protein
LKKPLYGLKQSPLAWFKKFTTGLQSLVFKPLLSDPCVFVKGSIWICIYVDDFLIFSPSSKDIETTIACIKKSFKLKELGDASKYLSLEISFSEDSIKITQTKLISAIISDLELTESKSAPTPNPPNVKSKDSDEPFADITFYQSVIGKVNYLVTCSRPDLSVALMLAARHTSAPTNFDYQRLRCIGRYLKATKDLGLVYQHEEHPQLLAFADASYASIDQEKSVTGFAIMLSGCAVSWSSCIQTSIPVSSCEAELNATKDCLQQVMFIRNMLILNSTHSKNLVSRHQSTFSATTWL